jgi:hypothetical protein
MDRNDLPKYLIRRYRLSTIHYHRLFPFQGVPQSENECQIRIQRPKIDLETCESTQ